MEFNIEVLLMVVANALLAALALLSCLLIFRLLRNMGSQTEPISKVTQTQQVVHVLNIEGTEKYEGDKRFVSGFGIKPSEVHDLRYVKGPAELSTMSERVQDCLKVTFEIGNSRGPGVPGLIHRSEELSKGEQLFFALVSRAGVPPTVISFVYGQRSSF